MKKLRQLIVLLAVTTAFAVSLALLRSAVGLTSPWFALMVMFNFLGLVAFARPLFLLKLPSFLRKEREWETKDKLYKSLGVPAFGALLRRTPLRYLNPVVYLKQCPDPSAVQAQIESAEQAHFLAAILLIPYMAYACLQGWWSAVVWLMIVQIGFNLYPILHLRWVRGRISRFRSRVLLGRRSAA